MAAANYTKLLLSAREAADIRLSEKGLTGSAFQGAPETEEDVANLSPAAPLVSKRTRKSSAEADQYDDFMTSYFVKLREENNQIKTEAAQAPEPTAVAPDYVESDIGSRLVGDLEEALGITEIQAAGLVGNLDHETGGFKFMQEIDPVVKGSKGGYGFAQWTGPRRRNFEAWSEENDVPMESYEANRDFLIHEILNTSEGRFLESLEKATTVEEAAKIVSKKYLRPGIPKLDSRISRAKKYIGGN